MLVPDLEPQWTWMWGEPNNFNAKAILESSFWHLLRFYHSKKHMEESGEVAYNPHAVGRPSRWHECQSPAINFLTSEQDRLFNHPGWVACSHCILSLRYMVSIDFIHSGR